MGKDLSGYQRPDSVLDKQMVSGDGGPPDAIVVSRQDRTHRDTVRMSTRWPMEFAVSVPTGNIDCNPGCDCRLIEVISPTPNCR